MKSRLIAKLIILLTVFVIASSLSHAARDDLCYSDFDGNMRIDFADFVFFASHFNQQQAHPNFSRMYDLNENNMVDFPDFIIFARNFNKAYTPPCSNGIKDCYEEDVDCGGVCSTCPIAAKPVYKKCSDGTEHDSCSTNKPLFCDNGELKKDCQKCGCRPAHGCMEDGSCQLKTCYDGTPYSACSRVQPFFCNGAGNLTNDCHNCGCPPRYECREDGSCEFSTCIPVIYNGDPKDKLDVLIVGDDYWEDTLPQFKNDVDVVINKLLSFEPFKSQQQKINFYRIDNTYDLSCHYNCGVDRCICCSWNYIERVAVDCPHDKVMVLLNNNKYGGCGSTSVAASYNGPQKGIVMTHEFGHTFGKLRDEYKYGYYPGYDKFPYLGDNCDPMPGCINWVDLMDVEGVGCYQGCQYEEWYRPIYSQSIMLDLGGDFNPVGEREINRQLEGYK